MLFLSHTPFQEIQNYCVSTNTVHLYTTLKVTEFRCSRNTIFSQGRNYLQVKPSIKYWQRSIFPTPCSIPHVLHHKRGLPRAGVPRSRVLSPADVPPALPTAPAHLEQLYVGMTSPATKTRPLLGWDGAAVSQGAT